MLKPNTDPFIGREVKYESWSRHPSKEIRMGTFMGIFTETSFKDFDGQIIPTSFSYAVIEDKSTGAVLKLMLIGQNAMEFGFVD